jgi:hypothetical protein
MRAVGEPVERAVGEDRIVEQGDPLIHGAVARDGGGRVAVPLDEDVIEVTGRCRPRSP